MIGCNMHSPFLYRPSKLPFYFLGTFIVFYFLVVIKSKILLALLEKYTFWTLLN